jgi:hypothetical protein
VVEREVGIKPNATALADKLANLLVEKDNENIINNLFYLDIYQLIYVEHLLELLIKKYFHQFHHKYHMHLIFLVKSILLKNKYSFRILFKFKKLLKLFDQQKIQFVY